MWLHRILLLRHKVEVLRFVLYFFHRGKDFFLRGNIYHPYRCEVNINFYMAMTAVFVAVVEFDTLNQRIDERRGSSLMSVVSRKVRSTSLKSTIRCSAFYKVWRFSSTDMIS